MCEAALDLAFFATCFLNLSLDNGYLNSQSSS
jgi:hypothetical protein